MHLRDFVVRYDPDKDSLADLTDRILYSIFVKRIKANKPLIAAVIAKSGEGKSWGINKLFEILMRIQNVKQDRIIDFFEMATITNPLDYANKIDTIFQDKNYKKLNMAIVHEAKMLINSATWQSFVNMAIADINSMSRAIKPLMFFYISQFIKDIDPKVRPTLTHYITFQRPLKGTSKMRIELIWNDERDIEKPKLKKRRITGFLVYPDGSYRRFTPSYFEVQSPSPEINEIFEKLDFEGKSQIIKHKLSKLLTSIKADIGITGQKIDLMVDYYAKDIDLVSSIAKRSKRGWRLNKNVRKMYDLTASEERLFEKKLSDKLKEQGVLSEEEIENA